MPKHTSSKEANLEQKLSQEERWIVSEVRTGRLQRTMAILAGFASIVSGFEAYTQHQRGHFWSRWMWTPVGLTPFMMAATAAAVFSRRAARLFLPVVSLSSLVDGLIGFGYHLRGIGRLPGGYKLGRYNIVIGPPIFAPLLMSSVGVLGLLASFFRREQLPSISSPSQPAGRSVLAAQAATTKHSNRGSEKPLQELESEIAQGRFQQGMALITAFFAILAGGEAYFEHLRGSFNQRVMWTPVLITPPTVVVAAMSMRNPAIARRALPFLSAINFLDGLTGFLLHLRGVKRMPGGFQNIAFNVTMGPPLFAPLLFTAVGLLGLIASLLRRE